MRDVTVAIPTIPSRSRYLSEALDSVAHQTILPEAVSIAYDKNGAGAWSTRNVALWGSQTAYTAFLDDDDILFPNHLQILTACAMDTGADLVYPWFEGGQALSAPWGGVRINPMGQYFGDEQKQWIMREQNFIPIAFLVRTELAKDVGGFPQPGTLEWPCHDAEDWGFLIKLLGLGADFMHVGVKTWHWRIHNTSTRGLP